MTLYLHLEGTQGKELKKIRKIDLSLTLSITQELH